MKLYIGADLVPTDANLAAYQSGDLSAVMDGKLLALLQAGDARIFNLECPLTDGGTPIDKCGPALRAPRSTVKGLQALGADFVTLANNHILDYGEQGLSDTRKTLCAAHIAYAGEGEGADRIGSYRLPLGELTVGIYCCAEHEFSVTPAPEAGAVGYDPALSLGEITRLKAECDRVIVLYHGGREMFPYPTPALRLRADDMAEAGADLIVCQHSHCIGCTEQINGTTVIYGQGNFHFDHPDEDSELWCTSLLLEVEITADRLTVAPIPLRLAGHRLTLAEGADRESILSGYAARSAAVADGSFLTAYNSLLDEEADYYLTCLAGTYFRGFFPRALNKFTGGRYKRRKLKKLYDKEALLRLLNYTRCETHRELLSDILERTAKGE